MNNYLIPANSKKSMLYFGLFNTTDLILFGSGIGLTLILMLILSVEKLINVLIVLGPMVVTGFLVFPVPNYHNVRTILKAMWEFYTTRQNFVWKGWCFVSEQDDKK